MRLKSPGRGDRPALIIADLLSPLRGSACSLSAVIPRLAPWATFLRRWCGLAWGGGLILSPVPFVGALMPAMPGGWAGMTPAPKTGGEDERPENV
jgi:hypothetical protein